MTTTKPKEPDTKDTTDWKHATVRQNCLAEAVKVDSDDPISLAERMYRFVIGEPIKQSSTVAETQKEWK